LPIQYFLERNSSHNCLKKIEILELMGARVDMNEYFYKSNA